MKSILKAMLILLFIASSLIVYVKSPGPFRRKQLSKPKPPSLNNRTTPGIFRKLTEQEQLMNFFIGFKEGLKKQIMDKYNTEFENIKKKIDETKEVIETGKEVKEINDKWKEIDEKCDIIVSNFYGQKNSNQKINVNNKKFNIRNTENKELSDKLDSIRKECNEIYDQKTNNEKKKYNEEKLNELIKYLSQLKEEPSNQKVPENKKNNARYNLDDLKYYMEEDDICEFLKRPKGGDNSKTWYSEYEKMKAVASKGYECIKEIFGPEEIAKKFAVSSAKAIGFTVLTYAFPLVGAAYAAYNSIDYIILAKQFYYLQSPNLREKAKMEICKDIGKYYGKNFLK